eukprot:Gregarina_sp_Poly_1__5258@NODE_2789_length_1715_cov_71_920510_g1756_i0_p1_GENE_NODE_2789_length_1715_cov_71_920510_g1756_i0NODE_2789_length_1715_cov_71_920510_g1756_i0_p1_ORF_typecomplete_len212_score20_98Longin/PF13774_6/6e09_NODE_2789_length_1715_cov_71_920510_g1756_i0192827
MSLQDIYSSTQLPKPQASWRRTRRPSRPAQNFSAMKLVSLLIFRVKPEQEKAILLAAHMDLSHFNYFIRSTIKEHIVFHSRLICSRTPIGCRQTIQFEQDLGNCHAFVHSCGLGGAVLSDPEYPARVAFVFLNRALAGFVEKHAPESWESLTADPPAAFKFPQGDELLKHFQNPSEADDLARIQADLNEVPCRFSLLSEQRAGTGCNDSEY